MYDNYPSFVLVGHPNKGKSSIVSTLAYDDSVEVSDIPGETKKTKYHSLKVGDKILYKIYDTPGFENARRALYWLEKNETTSKEHSKILKKFVKKNKNSDEFKEEIELLNPIVDGGAIIYVVDGSIPYKEEYEAEMKILSWSGNPSMALINKIGNKDYKNDWKNALNQHFKIVREFNPMNAQLDEKLKLLDAFSAMNQDWELSIDYAKEALIYNNDKMFYNTAKMIEENIRKSITYTVTSSLVKTDITDKDKINYEEQYKKDLIRFEKNNQKNVQTIWGHNRLDSSMEKFKFSDELFSGDFSKDGLIKKSFIIVSTVASASLAGATGFALSASTSFLDFGATATLTTTLSTVGGAVAGFTTSAIGYNKFINSTTIGKIFSKKRFQVGPMKNYNFIFILSARAIQHAVAISTRSHAKRDNMNLNTNENSAENLFDDTEKKDLAKISVNFRKDKNVKKSTEKYIEIIMKKIKIT
jgi:GTPase Era involved in 16S rRNA processing